MSMQRVKLGEVLTQRRDRVLIEPGNLYKQITVRLWGKGLVMRGVVDGTEIAAGSQVEVQRGDFLISKIDARHGAFGLVPEELAGSVVSNDFPSFEIDKSIADPQYIEWFSRTGKFVALCREASKGSTNRVRLNETAFLSLEIPLPSLELQKEIAGKFTHVRNLISTIKNERDGMAADFSALIYRLLHGSEACSRQLVPFGEIAQQRPVDISVEPDQEYQFAGVYSFGRGVFRGERKAGSEFSYRKLTQLHKNDFVYPKLMAWEGALGVVPEDCDGCFVSPEFPVFEFDQSVILPEVLDAFFRHPSTWHLLNSSSKGTNMRRKRFHPKAMKMLDVPIPPQDVQLTIQALMKNQTQLLPREDEFSSILPATIFHLLEEPYLQRNAKSERPIDRIAISKAEHWETIKKPFDEAVLVGAIIKAFTDDNGQPLGNFRLQKGVYFARRHLGERALDEEFLRKAAGPYNPKMRYSGGIKIAEDNDWIARAKGAYGEGAVLGEKSSELDEWIEKSGFAKSAAWVRDKFKFRKNEQWELLATVDYAKLALEATKAIPTASAILEYIEADDEWRPKVKNLGLSEEAIQNALIELQSLMLD